MKNYFNEVTYNGAFKNLDAFSDLGQEWSEELYNYFDFADKAQMESLLMLLNWSYELGYKKAQEEVFKTQKQMNDMEEKAYKREVGQSILGVSYRKEIKSLEEQVKMLEDQIKKLKGSK